MDEEGGGLLSWLKPDWQVIKAAPKAFIISIVAVGLVEFALIYWMFHTSLEMKNDYISNLQNKLTMLSPEKDSKSPKSQGGHNEPATYIELTRTDIYPDLFKPADTTKIEIYFANKGPSHAKDVSFGFVTAIRHSFITKPQEDEMFYDLLRNHKGSPKADMGVGNTGRRTIQTQMLSKKEADDLQSENTRLYVMGFIHYRDNNGQQTHEFCRWLQPPSVWHLCDGGHNRMVSGDTPY